VNIPRCFRANSSAKYFPWRSILTGISQYPAISPFCRSLEVPPNVPGAIQERFDEVRVLSAGSNSQEFRKGSLEIREFIAGGFTLLLAKRAITN
jgi:hypothetical protein